MQQRGRRSAAALALVPDGAQADVVRGAVPPATLSAEERAVWGGMVRGLPRDWFGSEHVPMMVAYCRHVVRADFLQAQLDAVGSGDIESPKGLKTFDLLRRMQMAETKAIVVLARSMRLTHQAKYRADKSHTLAKRAGGGGGAKPWEQ